MEANLQDLKIDLIIKFTAVFISLCFALSYTYHLGFLMQLGLTYSDIQISLADISKSALAAMPIILAFGIIPILITLVILFFTAHKILNIKIEKIIDPPPYNFPIFYYIIFPAIILFNLLTNANLMSIIFIIASPICGYILGRFKSKYGFVKLGILLTLPFSLLMSAQIGETIASSRTKSAPNTTIKIQDGTTISIIILNTYDAGVLIFENGHPKFIKWDTVTSITYKKTNPSPSIICNWDKNIKEIAIAACKSL